jgi:hypothetical protein
MTPVALTEDDPITLQEACEEMFHGTIKPGSLRSEADRGNLRIFRVGRRLYTTRAYVREMIDRCHVAPRARGYISTRTETNGLSETEQASFAQAAAEQALAQLKSDLRSTSPTSSARRRTPAR